MYRARTGWIPKRALTVTLGLIFVAALCLGVVAVGAGAQGEPPERLTEREATPETPARVPPASGAAARTDCASSSRARTETGSSSGTENG
jgi:hypothetical protein